MIKNEKLALRRKLDDPLIMNKYQEDFRSSLLISV